METEEQNYLKALDKLEGFLELNPSLNSLNKIASIFNKDHSQTGYKVSTLLNGLRDKGTVELVDNPNDPLSPWYRYNMKRTPITAKQSQNTIKQEMTDNEIKILVHLNKDKSQNNVESVLSDALQINEFDIRQVVVSLVEKDYILDISNKNQKNERLRAWKITPNGEIKVNEMQKKMIEEEQSKIEKPELYNVYINTGLLPQTILALDIDDVNKILEDIKIGEEETFIDGRTIRIGGLVTIKIYDVSKSNNKHDKGKLKNELKHNVGLYKLSWTRLLDYSGIERTHKFKIIKPSKKLTKIKTYEISDIMIKKNEVFIVHGHDGEAESRTARFIEKLGFKPIILHEQASSGKTIIEKIEEYSNVGFGIVLYTPCDIGGKQGDIQNLQSRARQNVVFEHGYLIGKIGRENVCALVKGVLEKPNDISGVVYVQMDGENAWQNKIAKEMRKSGYDVDMNKI